MSKYEAMRNDPANWKLGIVYRCTADPRVIVRQRLPVGWTWNFGHPAVFPAIAIAVIALLAPAALAWWMGLRSVATVGLLTLMALVSIMIVASRIARDPGE